MSRKSNLYVGRAGQFAVLSEFLMRGYNVAIPEVDVGDDVFVVKDDDGQYWRIQVKAANGVPRTYGCSAKFDRPDDVLVPLSEGFDIMRVTDSVQRHYLRQALSRTDGNKTAAARLLGLNSHQVVTNWMERLGVAI